MEEPKPKSPWIWLIGITLVAVIGAAGVYLNQTSNIDFVTAKIGLEQSQTAILKGQTAFFQTATAPTSTIIPTQSPLPTYTAYPTYTLYPTYTHFPTNASLPLRTTLTTPVYSQTLFSQPSAASITAIPDPIPSGTFFLTASATSPSITNTAQSMSGINTNASLKPLLIPIYMYPTIGLESLCQTLFKYPIKFCAFGTHGDVFDPPQFIIEYIILRSDFLLFFLMQITMGLLLGIILFIGFYISLLFKFWLSKFWLVEIWLAEIWRVPLVLFGVGVIALWFYIMYKTFPTASSAILTNAGVLVGLGAFTSRAFVFSVLVIIITIPTLILGVYIVKSPTIGVDNEDFPTLCMVLSMPTIFLWVYFAYKIFLAIPLIPLL